MKDDVMIIAGECKGSVGIYKGKSYDEGKWLARIEMDYSYEVEFPFDSVMFLHNGESDPNKERDESYNQQRYEQYQILKNKDRE